METKKDPKRDAELSDFLSDLKDKVSEEHYAVLLKTLETGYDQRNRLFETAGIDKSILEKLENTVENENFTVADICNLIAPEIRKAFSVDLDPENAEPGQIKLKKKDKNLFDEIGMSNEKLAELLTTFSKCYQNDTDEDWHHLNQIMLDYADKFFEPAYAKAKDAGLLEQNASEKMK
jgi:DNA-binding Xre family transcriptional regulator